MRHIALLLIAAALLACGSPPQRPASPGKAAPRATDDQVVRGVGNLRRLVALPVVVEQGSCDWPDVARDLDEAAIRFLREWKGYEPVRPADTAAAWSLAREVGAWQEKAGGAGKPPADLRARLMVAGEEASADGVLVIHSSPECPGGSDAGLLTLPARLAGSLNRSLSAGVYEAERGTLVWHNRIRPPGWDPGRYGAQPPPRFETRQASEALFAPIENAVPAVLKPPPRPPKPAAEPPPSAVVVTPAREPTALAPTPLPSGVGAASPPAAPAAATDAASPPPPMPAPAPDATAATHAATAVTPPPAGAPPESPPPETAAPPAATPAPGAIEPAPSAPSGHTESASPPAGSAAGSTPPAADSAVPPTAQPSEPAAAPPAPTGDPVPALPAPEGPGSPAPAESPGAPVAPETPPAPDAEPPPTRAPIRT
jgi:hypothetical protein